MLWPASKPCARDLWQLLLSCGVGGGITFATCVHLQSNFPFPAKPWCSAVHSSKRTSHHLIVYYAVPVHVGPGATDSDPKGNDGIGSSDIGLSGEDAGMAGRLILSAAECDAAVWVVSCQVQCHRTQLLAWGPPMSPRCSF